MNLGKEEKARKMKWIGCFLFKKKRLQEDNGKDNLHFVVPTYTHYVICKITLVSFVWKDLQERCHPILKFPCLLWNLAKKQQKHSKNIRQKATYLFLSVYSWNLTIQTICKITLFPLHAVTNAVSGLPKIEIKVARILPAPSRNNILNTSKDSPNKRNILHSIHLTTIMLAILYGLKVPSNITTAKCSNSISEVGSKG